MPEIHSSLHRHLRYRLWIAEMNADTVILRIFDDHLADLSSRKKSAATKKALENFSKQFSDSRREIDELKHEMHLVKMKLAANIRHPDEKQDVALTNNHPSLEKRYNAFCKTFEKLKKDFVDFEPEQ